ncbi:hypothetical protein COTS27_00051 [Spirochaetota bacterium]|nr:hypothetical protein COTS27_00051 [Spirochaetota bacterium]
MDCKLEQAELVGIFNTDNASCCSLASRKCSVFPAGLVAGKERLSTKRTSSETTDNKTRRKNAAPHIIIDHKNQSLKNNLFKQNTSLSAKPYLGESLTCTPLFWVKMDKKHANKDHASWQRATVYKWTFNVLRQAKAASIVFDGILQTEVKALDQAEIRIQISYTLNWRNEWVVRHAYEAKTDVKIMATQGVLFPLTRTSYQKLKNKVRNVLEEQNACPLLDVRCLTDTEDHVSVHAVPREFSTPSSSLRLHDKDAGKNATENAAKLSQSYQVKWGRNLHHWFSIPLVTESAHSIFNVDIYSDATALYGSLRKIGEETYLYLDVHSFLPLPKKKNSEVKENSAIEDSNPKYKNAPHLPVWTLRREKRYQYTTIYRFT